MNAARWLDRFEEWMALRQIAATTRANYRQRTRIFLEYLAERNLALTQVTREVLEDYRLRLFYRHYLGRPIGPASQANHLVAVKKFFRFLIKDNALLLDPTAELDLPRLPSRLPRSVPSEKEIRRLLEAPDVGTLLGLRDRAILELLYATGLRNAELRHLTLDAVRLEERLVWVFRGKGDKSRVVPLGREAAYWLSEYLVRARPRLARSAAEKHLFLGSKGPLRSSMSLNKVIQRAAVLAGAGETVTPHGFRHACATHMLRHGAGLRQLQEILGHSSAGTTQRYTKVEVSDLRRVHRRCHPRERRKRPEPAP